MRRRWDFLTRQWEAQRRAEGRPEPDDWRELCNPFLERAERGLEGLGRALGRAVRLAISPILVLLVVLTYGLAGAVMLARWLMRR